MAIARIAANAMARRPRPAGRLCPARVEPVERLGKLGILCARLCIERNAINIAFLKLTLNYDTRNFPVSDQISDRCDFIVKFNIDRKGG